jgi:hypothetical protein
MRRKAQPYVSIHFRVPLDVEARHQRLLELLDCGTTQLFARALEVLEAQVAPEASKATAA